MRHREARAIYMPRREPPEGPALPVPGPATSSPRDVRGHMCWTLQVYGALPMSLSD